MSKNLGFEIGDWVSDGGDEDGYVRSGKITFIDYTNPESPKLDWQMLVTEDIFIMPINFIK